jgi:hypothetical protein
VAEGGTELPHEAREHWLALEFYFMQLKGVTWIVRVMEALFEIHTYCYYYYDI